MKIIATLPLLAALVQRASGAGGGQWFSYFHKGGLGPDRWALLQTPDNQCGGGITEEPFVQYGQSPVPVETTSCKATFDYTFEAGTCTFNDLKFSLSNNGVKVEPVNDCVFGRMQIPHFPEENGNRKTFKALQYHIHTSSEHTINGRFYDAELHVVHAEELDDGSVSTPYTVWGSMMTGGASVDHPIFEEYLRGWEKAADTQERACAESSGGERERERQRKLQRQNTFVPVVDEEITTGNTGCYTLGVGKTSWNAQDFVDGTTVPDIYTELINNNDGTPAPQYGSYTYKGGLTTPPCTQIVNWNLMDDSIKLSDSQMQRLQKLIWCYVEPSCNHATAADREGSTSRPPLPLAGREIIHRCQVNCAGCESIVDTAPPPEKPGDGFKKPPPKPENPNTSEGQCNKAWTKGCPEDKRANPNVSPNLKANAAVWNDFEGLWVGQYSATDRNGVPLTETFVNKNLTVELPYDRSTVFMAVNRTIIETKYYEHIYFVYAPADSTPNSALTGVEFCTLPMLENSGNVLGGGRCGDTGWTAYSERFGTATHEKDGVASIFDVSGRFGNASEGSAVPVADKSIYISMRGDKSKITETLTFTNDQRTKVGGSGQTYIFENFEPYLSDPHESTFTYFLDQVSADDFKARINEAYLSHEVLKTERLPNPMTRECLDTQCPTPQQWNSQDPLTTATPYSEDASASGWFIAVMVILGVIVLLVALWFLHKHQIKKQKDRISRQFARRVAETIKVEGSHTQLSPEALEEEFKRIDADHNGYLTKSELKAFVNSGKIGEMTDSDFNALFAALDVDGNGTVDFTEFCAFMAQCGNVYDEIEGELTPEDRRKSIARRISSRGMKDEEAGK